MQGVFAQRAAWVSLLAFASLSQSRDSMSKGIYLRRLCTVAEDTAFVINRNAKRRMRSFMSKHSKTEFGRNIAVATIAALVFMAAADASGISPRR
jgi:hypothetical protein